MSEPNGMIDGTDASAEFYHVDTTVACPARVYDYLLGGTSNFKIDRIAVNEASRYLPGGLDNARANVRSQRELLVNVVGFLAGEAGVRQFLDIGSGIPTENNVHEVAQRVAPSSQVVYVDNDPVVLANSHQFINDGPEGATKFLVKDLHDPVGILEKAADTLEFTEPVALMLVGILHYLPDADDPFGIVAHLVDALAPGSYMAVSHLASDIEAETTARAFNRANKDMRAGGEFVLRSHGEVSRFFAGLELVEPGVVHLDEWRTEPSYEPGVIRAYAGLAMKT